MDAGFKQVRRRDYANGQPDSPAHEQPRGRADKSEPPAELVADAVYNASGETRVLGWSSIGTFGPNC